jgi:hypothetical protein
MEATLEEANPFVTCWRGYFSLGPFGPFGGEEFTEELSFIEPPNLTT